MSDRDWNKELAKIDRQLENVSDAALFPTPRGGGSATAPTAAAAEVQEKRRTTSTFGVFFRLLLSLAAGIGMIFWPAAGRCGLELLGYLAACALVTVSGVWSAVWTWRHRAGRAHLVALLLVVWGIALAAVEILPRVGYAVPTPERSMWGCSQ
ncbi:MAG: hypothetical protein ACJ79S_08145 [Gemmatimonadaceae bacterium]